MREETPDDDEYSRLIVANLDFIKKQCRRAVDRPSTYQNGDAVDLDNEADALLNEVLDRLKADDYRALRNFQGKAKLTTYLTTIITHQIVNIVRSRKGRSRAKERARAMGETAQRLYDMVYTRGLSVRAAQAALAIDFGIHEKMELLLDLLQRMRGRDHWPLPIPDGSTWLAHGQEIVDDSGQVEVEVADPSETAEDELVARQRQSLARQMIDELLGSLTGEEQLLIRLRFPSDDDESPMSLREIGELIGLTEKAAHNRIQRILIRFREKMLRSGLALDDFMEV